MILKSWLQVLPNSNTYTTSVLFMNVIYSDPLMVHLYMTKNKSHIYRKFATMAGESEPKYIIKL